MFGTQPDPEPEARVSVPLLPLEPGPPPPEQEVDELPKLQSFTVCTAAGHGVTVMAVDYEVGAVSTGDDLTFTDQDGEYSASFAPGMWRYVIRSGTSQ